MKQPLVPDQTQFAAESPLYESAVLEHLTPEEVSDLENKQAKAKRKRLIIIGVVALVILIIGLVVAITLRSGSEEKLDLITQESEIDKVILGPFNQRLDELVKEVELADPNQEELPFPPINFEISLEDK
jgi:hypothetical protein